MRRYVDAESSIRHDLRKRLIDALDWLAIPFDRKPLPAPFPSSQMRQEVIWQWHNRLTFIRLRTPGRTAVEYATIKINPAVADSRLQSGPAHCAGPRAGVERDQDQARDMPPRSAAMRNVHRWPHRP